MMGGPCSDVVPLAIPYPCTFASINPFNFCWLSVTDARGPCAQSHNLKCNTKVFIPYDSFLDLGHTSGDISAIRQYIDVCRKRQSCDSYYTLDAELEDEMTHRFADWKQECRLNDCGKLFGDEMIYVWCDLFRAFAHSQGVAVPTLELWKKFETLERERLERLKHFYSKVSSV